MMEEAHLERLEAILKAVPRTALRDVIIGWADRVLRTRLASRLEGRFPAQAALLRCMPPLGAPGSREVCVALANDVSDARAGRAPSPWPHEEEAPRSPRFHNFDAEPWDYAERWDASLSDPVDAAAMALTCAGMLLTGPDLVTFEVSLEIIATIELGSADPADKPAVRARQIAELEALAIRT